MKRCAKCDGPIPEPVLGDDPGERCPLCGDEPPSGPDLALLLREAMKPLISFRDRALDVDSPGESWPRWQRGAAADLDDAFLRLDGCLRALENEEW